MSHRRPEPDPHGWNSRRRYIEIHETCLEECRTYFVEHDTLTFTALSRHRIVLAGVIFCRGGLEIHVNKTLERNDSDQVRGILYNYHAQFSSMPERPVFRYDNAHGYPDLGHQDDFHKHVFSDRTWKEIEPPLWIGRYNWPVLAEVINELHQWWLDHQHDRFIYP